MDTNDDKYEKLRAKMKAPLLPARRIGDAVPKTRWLVSRQLKHATHICQLYGSIPREAALRMSAIAIRLPGAPCLMLWRPTYSHHTIYNG